MWRGRALTAATTTISRTNETTCPPTCVARSRFRLHHPSSSRGLFAVVPPLVSTHVAPTSHGFSVEEVQPGQQEREIGVRVGSAVGTDLKRRRWLR